MIDPQQVLDAARQAIAEMNALGIEVPRGVRETQQLARMAVEAADLRDLVTRLQCLTGGHFCAYCGYEAPALNDDLETVAAIQAHVAQCEHHPQRALIDACQAAYHLTSSLLAVRDGATDALLRSVGEACREALERAGVDVIKTQEAGPACRG